MGQSSLQLKTSLINKKHMKPYLQSSKHPNQSNGTFDITVVFLHRGSIPAYATRNSKTFYGQPRFFQIHAVVRVPHDARRLRNPNETERTNYTTFAKYTDSGVLSLIPVIFQASGANFVR
jgi:uncharacterized membrane protein YhdT